MLLVVQCCVVKASPFGGCLKGDCLNPYLPKEEVMGRSEKAQHLALVFQKKVFGLHTEARCCGSPLLEKGSEKAVQRPHAPPCRRASGGHDQRRRLGAGDSRL